MTEVVVLGGGVTGLTSALQLARRGYSVQIWTEKRGMAAPNWIWEYPPYNVAGVSSSGPAPDPQIVQRAEESAMRWARLSYPEFVRLARSEPAADVHMMPVFNLSRHTQLSPNPGRDFLIGYVHGSKALRSAKEFTPLEYVDAETYLAPGCHGPTYLKWLLREFRKLGGVFCQKTVESIADCVASIPCRVLVNCSGLGARELVPDANIYPCKGQLLHLSAPWANAVVFSDEPDAYAIALPGHDLELGGTAQDFVETRHPDHSVLDRIRECNTMVQPSLSKATGGDAWIGIRPKRLGGINLTMERLNVAGEQRAVVHNYGHGGAGMCTSYGCADEVVELVTGFLRSSKL